MKVGLDPMINWDSTETFSGLGGYHQNTFRGLGFKWFVLEHVDRVGFWG